MGHSASFQGKAARFRNLSIPQSAAFLALPLFCFSIYLSHLCPTFLDDDSAETITSGFTLGIQHPPGYALDSLWVRILCLVPLGGPCFRVNLGSALLASLSALILFVCIRLAIGQTRSRWVPLPKGLDLVCALSGALIFALTRTPWEKALGAKGGLYLLQEALILGFFLGWLLHEKEHPSSDPSAPSPGPGEFKARWLLMAFFLFAAGLSNHWETQAVFSPLLLLFFLRNLSFQESGRRLPPIRVLLTAGSLCLFGLSPLLYLPLRAHLHPFLNLGAPDSLSNFLSCFFRRYTAFRETSLLQTFWASLKGALPWGRFLEVFHLILKRQGSVIPSHLWTEMTFPTLLLSVLGFAFAWREKIHKTLLFIAIPFALLSLALWSSLFIPSDSMSWYIDNFLLPTHWMVAFLAAFGLVALGLFLFSLPSRQGRPLQWLWVISVCAAIPLYLFSVNDLPLDEQNQMFRYDYGANLLKSSPPNAVFFAEGDEDYFPLYYFQGVEKRRPDIRMIPSFTLFETWGVDQIERFHPELGLTASTLSFPDPIARSIYSFSEIVVKNRGLRPCVFSYVDGAFHRYYLSRYPSLVFRRSGNLLELTNAAFASSPVLDISGLRLRHAKDCPSNSHPSLGAIWTVYRSLGLFPL